MRNTSKPELLSPAGKWDSLVAAVQNGADAVYLGEKSFSARKNAANFSWEEIKEAVKYCHIRNVKVHLALNTLASDDELSLFESSVIKAADCGVDALIIQDIGCGKIAHSVCPQMELHASTQLTACNEYDVAMLTKSGFSRVVLSRELSEEEIRRISQNSDAELEAFVHGALCISFSGKCLMSSFIGGRSGNRGECAQPCRKLYNYGKKSGYFLSPRDLCLADELKAMIDAGISSFKIEGRMKSPEYVAAVTSVYRKYLDTLSPLQKEDEDRLKKIFVRGDGFTKAYFKKVNTPSIMNYSISNDNLSARADSSALKAERTTFREGVENRKLSVDAALTIRENIPSSLTLTDGKNTVTAIGAQAESARTLPLSKERAQSQIAKLGNTPYSLSDFCFNTDNTSTLPVSSLNLLRRDACELLSEKRSQIESKKTYSFAYPTPLNNKTNTKPYVVAEIFSKEQFSSCLCADRILVPLHLWDSITPNEKCFLLLPEVVTDVDDLKTRLSSVDASYGVYASSMGMLDMARKMGHKAYADWGMNIYNSVAMLAAAGLSQSVTLSPELSLKEIKRICKSAPIPCEAVCYGYQRVMTSRACLIRGITEKCDCSSPLFLKDTTGAQFMLSGSPVTHINSLYNSRPTFMADKLKELCSTEISGIRLCFTKESADEIEEIIAMYQGKCAPKKPPVFTRGYFLK